MWTKTLPRNFEFIADTNRTRSKSLDGLCETGSVARHETVTKFVQVLPAILDTFERMEKSSDATVASKGLLLLCAMLSPKFILSLCVSHRLSKLIADF